MAYNNPDGTYSNEVDLPVRVIAPLTGDVVQLQNADRLIYIVPAGVIAALTVKLSPHNTGSTGPFIEVCFGAGVTALTLQDFNGNALVVTNGAPGAGAAGTSFVLRRIQGVWVRWR